MDNGYNIYRGVGSAAAIDFDSPVGFAPAGTTHIDLVGLGHTIGVEYFYAIRAVSAGGVPDDSATAVRVCITSGGAIEGNAPNTPFAARTAATAGGKARVAFSYSAFSSPGKAVGAQVATCTAGVPDWINGLIQTIGVSSFGLTTVNRVLTTVFTDGPLQLAIRAITAAGTPGTAVVLPAITIDGTPPAAVDYLSLQQEAS
jgi:hypothetical protein